MEGHKVLRSSRRLWASKEVGIIAPLLVVLLSLATTSPFMGILGVVGEPADSQIADMVPADSQVAENVPADSQIAENVPADSQIAEKVPADPLIADMVPADSQVADNVPADSQIAVNVPADSQIADMVPALTATTPTTPADSPPLINSVTELTVAKPESPPPADADEEPQNRTQDMMALFDNNVDCNTVDPFPADLFSSQPDESKVYLVPQRMEEGIFSGMGFDKYVTVFGVRIVASSDVTNEQLDHAAKIFAQLLDSNSNGEPDMPSALKAIQEYVTVVGYLSNPDESDVLWTAKFRAKDNEEFRRQFICHMHFFEQWASDASPEFHVARKASREVTAAEEGTDTKCGNLQGDKFVNFDWPVWYFAFTATYYGYLEVFDQPTLKMLNDKMTLFREKGKFNGSYPDDHEMEMADFFVWSLITKLGAVECHCETEVIKNVWKICTAEELKKADSQWFELLDTLEGLPKSLPNGEYESTAVAESQTSA